MQVFTIFPQQPGPLPLKTQFNAPLDGDALLVVTGSEFSTTANTMLQMDVYLDGAVVGSAKLFSNAPSTHRALPTLFLNVSLSYGPHTLALVANGSNVTSDFNDFFGAAILF